MTHDELLAKIDDIEHKTNHTSLLLGVQTALLTQNKALRAVVELHEPEHSIRGYRCTLDDELFPCKHHQAIEKELSK